MRKFFLILMALSVCLGIMAQDRLSSPTKVFMQQRAAGVAQNRDGKHALAAPKTVNGVECVECFISLDGASIADLEANGVKVTGKYNGFVTASIPISKLEAVSQMKGVKQVGISRNVRLLTDVAKGIVNADKAWDGTNYGLPQGYTGQGVVVGLIDMKIRERVSTCVPTMVISFASSPYVIRLPSLSINAVFSCFCLSMFKNMKVYPPPRTMICASFLHDSATINRQNLTRNVSCVV